MKLFILVATVFFLGSFAAQAQKKDKTPKTITPPGTLSFIAESNLYKANASFKEWRFVKLSMPKEGLEGMKGTVEVFTNSVVERTIRVSNDLKTEPYFDAKSFPKATAKILEVKKIAGQDKKYTAKIELKIKKYKKVVESEFELLNDTQPYQIKGEINVMKEDFQVGMGNNMGTIKSEVKILYETELKLSE